MNKIKAFTMSEALIVLGIIAVIATLSVIAVQNAKPDTDVVMFKKHIKQHTILYKTCTMTKNCTQMQRTQWRLHTNLMHQDCWQWQIMILLLLLTLIFQNKFQIWPILFRIVE